MNFSTIGKVCKVSKIFKILIVGALGCLLFDTVDELCILIKIRNDFQHYVKVLVKFGKSLENIKLSIIHVLCSNYSKTKVNSTFWTISKVSRMQGNILSYISKATNNEYQAKWIVM